MTFVKGSDAQLTTHLPAPFSATPCAFYASLRLDTPTGTEYTGFFLFIENRLSAPETSPDTKFCSDTIEQHSMLIFDFFPRYTICVLASIFHSRSELSLLQERMRVLLLEATVCRCPEIDVINDSCPYLRVTRLSRDHSVSMYVVSTMFHSLRVLSMPPLYNYASRHSASPTMLSRCSNSDVIMPRWPRITSLQFVM